MSSDIDNFSKTLSWLPVDLAAKSIVEVIFSETHRPLWHILNSSKKTTWETVWNALRTAGIDFDVVSKKEWINRLRKSSPDVTVNPTYKLVDFFGNKVSRFKRYHLAYVTHNPRLSSMTTTSLPKGQSILLKKQPKCLLRLRASRTWMRRLLGSL